MNLPTFSHPGVQHVVQQISQRLVASSLNRFFSLIGLVLLAWLAARLTWLLWPEPQVPLLLVNTASSPAQSSSPSLDALLAADLFGRFQAETKAEPQVAVVTDAPQTSLNLKLTGVVATKAQPEQGTAIIESSGVELVYAVDEQIEGTSATLKQVLEDRVLLQVGGRFETLMLDGVEYQALSEANSAIDASVPEVSASPEPMALSPEQIDLNQVRRELLAQPAKFDDYVRITARHRNGQLYGFALTPGKDPEVFARMGFMPNDVAIEINGLPLNDLQQAMGIMKELREAKEASIKVERDGEIKDVLFSLSQ